MEPVMMPHPDSPYTMVWGWRRCLEQYRSVESLACRVTLWLPAENEEAFRSTVAAIRLKSMK
jgi:hypothetical protein